MDAPFSFTTGILVGQGSLILILILFIRYVIFEDGSKSTDPTLPKKKLKLRRPSQLTRASSAPRPPTLPSQILSKTQYDLSTHPTESMDWLNVLFGQVIANYRSSLLSHGGEEGARQMMEEWLNPKNGVSWLDPIQVTSLSLGNSYPIFSNARIRPSDASGRMRAETEIDYSDSVTLGISTSLLINFPRPRFAVLPISLGVTLTGLTGTVSIELLSTNPTTDRPSPPTQSIQLALHPDFSLSIETTSLLGSRAKLHDLPKIEQLVSSRIRLALVDRVVWPKFFAVGLPGLGIGVSASSSSSSSGLSPSKKEEGEEEKEEEEEEEEEEEKTTVDRLGDKLMKGVLPTPTGLDVHLVEQAGMLSELGRNPPARSSSFATMAPSVPVPPRRRETGLGGGLKSMPGGSDWGANGL